MGETMPRLRRRSPTCLRRALPIGSTVASSSVLSVGEIDIRARRATTGLVYAAPSISTSASQFTGAFKGSIMPIDERACIPTSGP